MDNPSPPPAGKVLIIDDESGLRKMLQFGLARRGYEVSAAGDGDEAIALARNTHFDLAVCDIMMPGKSGLEVLAILKEFSPQTEIIMATGYATLETAVEAMKRGAFDYITKPYTLHQLCAIFEKAMEHRRLKAKVDHLEEVIRLKNEFVASMSHELRTPLASTIGFISLLSHGIYGSLNEAQKTALQRAESNSHHLLEQINSILDFSKLSADRMTLTLDPFSFHDIVTEVMQTMEPLAAEHKLSLHVKGSDTIPLLADKMKMKQILLNLVSNAIKFTKTGGVSIIIHPASDDGSLRFDVQDTGIGIAEKDLSLLFQEFRQIDGSTTREVGGTGLGLAICKKLVELMKGSIEVASTPGKGTCFTVTLPVIQHLTVADTSAPQPILLTPSTPILGERVIVAIDDDPDVLKLISDSLIGTGFRLITAHSGEEGLALIRKVDPYSVLLDITMPKMDGWEVLRVLKNDPQLRSIPVYIVSVIDNQARAFSMGVAGYIQKPFAQEQLLKQLEFIPRKMKQIFVVDDDADMRRIFTDALKGEGYDVVPFPSGEEAIARMVHLCPDILFLDLMLPGLSGFEVLQSMEERFGTERVAVFVMTAKELTQEENDYLQRRVQMVLRKGITPLAKMIEILNAKLNDLRKSA